ncbi:MAG: hypothetical protein MUO85_01155 [candidate division Zixibacteria bacterium]|nr:hypothetical protein [candidate division Zixibacteria bacterium]
MRNEKMRKDYKTFIVWAGGMLLAIMFGCLVPFLRCSHTKADIYAPSDSVPLTVGTTDTTLLTVADVESVWFKWFRPAGTIVDSSKITSSTRTGLYIKKVKASDASNTIGTYFWEAVAYKNTKTGIKTGSWVVKPDSMNVYGLNSTKLSYIDASISSRSSHSASDVWSVATRTLTDYSGVWSVASRTLSDYSGVWSVATRSLTDKAGFKLAQDGLDPDSSFTQLQNKVNTNLDVTVSSRSTLTAGGVWGYSGDITLTDTIPKVYAVNAGASDPDTVAKKVWQYSGNITLVDTIPKTYAVNASGSDPDTLANKVWTWSTRTLTSGAGTGAYQVKIITKQSSDSSEIVGTTVQVLNSTQSSTIGLLSTGSNGDATFALDADTFKIRMYKPGWQFNVPETAIVSGDTNIIYYADIFNPGNPPSADLCRVYGWIKDINNLPVIGAKVEAKVKTAPLRFGSVVISPYYKVTTTDSDGYWYLDLYPNIDLTPNDTKYQFFIYSPAGTILNLAATVPHQGSWELSF